METLKDRIRSKTARTGVIGIGYVGLPLAVAMAEAGFHTVGIDVEEERVRGLLNGESHVPDVPSEKITPLLRNGRFTATSDPSVIEELDAISICVPTPLRKTKDPDMSFINEAVGMITSHLGCKKLIVLESTTYPGTTEEVILPRLEEKGFQIGREFHLAFSPERIDPGNKIYRLDNTPKIVGGISSECTEMAAIFYEQFIQEVVRVSSARAAEMVKLLENTFRSVNIGLVNEMALMCDKMGLDVWEVVDAASSKPFGFMPFYPGPGLGGHCLPIDPYYLSWKARTYEFYARFIELAGEINRAMPEHVFQKIVHGLNEQGKCVNSANILVLGVSYKSDVGDTRESPALDVMELIRRAKGHLSYSDPYVPELELGGLKLSSTDLTREAVQAADCLVLITNHSGIDLEAVVEWCKLFIDTRNATKNLRDGLEKVIRI